MIFAKDGYFLEVCVCQEGGFGISQNHVANPWLTIAGVRSVTGEKNGDRVC